MLPCLLLEGTGGDRRTKTLRPLCEAQLGTQDINNRHRLYYSYYPLLKLFMHTRQVFNTAVPTFISQMFLHLSMTPCFRCSPAGNNSQQREAIWSAAGSTPVGLSPAEAEQICKFCQVNCGKVPHSRVKNIGGQQAFNQLTLFHCQMSELSA